jgi:uncharacterized membrane protein
MRISRPAIKQNARKLIRETKPSPMLVGLAYLGIAYILQVLSISVSGQYRTYLDTMEQLMLGNYDYVPSIPQISPPAALLGLAIALLMLVMSMGFTIYALRVARQEKSGVGNLFDGFAIFFRLLWLSILMEVFIFLWALLLFIPGIIAAYRYRMAVYLLIENPGMSALDCIRESKRMMDGHKAELFVLDLSFLGWNLLAAFPFVSVWVMPYTSVTYANYYLALRNMPQPGWEPADFRRI